MNGRMTDDRTAALAVTAGLSGTNANALTQVIQWIDAVFTESQPSRSKRREGQ